MNLWKWRTIANWSFYAGVCVMFSSLIFFNRNSLACAVLGLGFLLVVIYCLVCRHFWRCPHCGKGLPLRKGSVEKQGVCPFCGNDLRDRGVM